MSTELRKPPAPSEAELLALTTAALICTRDRPEAAARAVASVLSTDGICRNVIVVDQSDDDRTRDALRYLLDDSRLRYIRSQTRGKGAALNEGLRATTADVIVLTDDDCEVTEGWAPELARIFQERPEVAVVFGSVISDEHDPEAGFIPEYRPQREGLCRNMWDKLRARGIGANMAVRRSAVLEMGGFDASLGPGGRFPACVDGDMAVRSLLAGHLIYETGRSVVYHRGFRDWEEGRELTRRAWLGIGAAYVKPLKCGRLSVLPVFLYEFLAGALLPFAWAMLTFRRPAGWLRVKSFAQGALAGARAPVDRGTLTYRS